jgi:hypothetical protein
MAAMIAGWMIDSLLDPWLGDSVTFVVSLVASTVVFFLMRNWLRQLRDG